jgi:hypothetical protein
MASEPVLSREVGNRTSRVTQPVMVTSAMLLCCFDVFRLLGKDSEVYEDDQLKLGEKRKISGRGGETNRIIHEGKGRNYICRTALNTYLYLLGAPSEWWG